MKPVAHNEVFVHGLIAYGEITTRLNTQPPSATAMQQQALETAHEEATTALCAIVDAHVANQIAEALSAITESQAVCRDFKSSYTSAPVP